MAEEFVILAVLTAVAVEFQLYELWAGILLGFFIHLLSHFVQFAIYKKYVPVIFTSVFSAVYCVIALHDLSAYQALSWQHVSLWTVIFTFLIGLNIMLMTSMAEKFDGWLNTAYLEE